MTSTRTAGKDIEQFYEEDGSVEGTASQHFLGFEGIGLARGVAFLGMGRGALLASNIFMVTGLTYLAKVSVGCVERDKNTGEIIGTTPHCTKKIYGLDPISLITLVPSLACIISAFLMPVIGAIIDYTPHRRAVGIWATVFIVIVQTAQIFTIERTWFIMAILQALAAFAYLVQVLATYAYFPDIARIAGEDKMTDFSAKFSMTHFALQVVFISLITGFDIDSGYNDERSLLNDGVMAQISQALNVAFIIPLFYSGWKLIEDAPANHVLGEGKSILTVGFIQLWTTAKNVKQKYRKGVLWFFLTTIFAEGGTGAFPTVSVIYLNEVLGMDGVGIGIIFITMLFMTIPGAKIGALITKRTNPNTSWQLSMVAFIVSTGMASFVLIDPSRRPYSYIFGICWGLIMGWFHSTENLYLSLVFPKGQEAEFTGVWLYCSQIIGWIPPLVFTAMHESGIHMRWALMHLNLYFVVAIILLSCVSKWEEVIAEANGSSLQNTPEVGKKEREQGKISEMTEIEVLSDHSL